VIQCRLGRLGGQLAGGDPGIGQMALPYAGTLDDPGVRGLDLARRQFGRKIIVSHDAWRQIAARSNYLGIRHSRFQKPGGCPARMFRAGESIRQDTMMDQMMRWKASRFAPLRPANSGEDDRWPAWCLQADHYALLHAPAAARSRRR